MIKLTIVEYLTMLVSIAGVIMTVGLCSLLIFTLYMLIERRL